jgi:hypothetical protein
MTRKMHIILSFIFLLSWGMMPLVIAQDSYNWAVDEDDEIIFEIEGKEGEETILMGEVTLTIEEITGAQISYSFTPSYSVDTEKYGQFMQENGTYSSITGYIANNHTETYTVGLVYSQETFALMENAWALYAEEYYDQFWIDFGDNDTISWECISSAHGYRIVLSYQGNSEIWYLQASYSSDGFLDIFSCGNIFSGDTEDYVRIARARNSVFGGFIPGFPLLFFGVFGVVSLWIIIQRVNKKERWVV